MSCEIIYDRETDGRWIAEIESLPGVMAYGKSRKEAMAKVTALSIQVTDIQACRLELIGGDKHDGS